MFDNFSHTLNTLRLILFCIGRKLTQSPYNSLADAFFVIKFYAIE